MPEGQPKLVTEIVG
uniref:Uncharacterized protein n=1 Tax=Rhizophora mucronata TaxID=61149 RepID=A0A2P2Q864_RHIMU